MLPQPPPPREREKEKKRKKMKWIPPPSRPPPKLPKISVVNKSRNEEEAFELRSQVATILRAGISLLVIHAVTLIITIWIAKS